LEKPAVYFSKVWKTLTMVVGRSRHDHRQQNTGQEWYNADEQEGQVARQLHLRNLLRDTRHPLRFTKP